MSRPVEQPRLWGIDVIGAVCAVATLLLVYVFFVGTIVGCVSAAILAPLCAVLSIGMFRRVNSFRILLLVLLGIALVGNGLLTLVYLAGVFEFVALPPNIDPLEKLVRMPFNLALTAAVFLYLRRAAVRDAFISAETSNAEANADEVLAPEERDA